MKLNLAAFLLALFSASLSMAVIPAKMPLFKAYETSGAVLIGKITAANPANRLIETQVTETLKGEAVEKVRLQLQNPAALFDSVQVGNSIVIMIGKGRGAALATIHLANTWVIANLKSDVSPPLWQIIQEQSNDFKKTFPGPTDALVDALREIKTGKPTFLDNANDRLFVDGVSEIAQLKTTATSLFAADLKGDKSQQLIIATPHGPRIFSADKGEDITQNAGPPAAGNLLAVGDLNGDGKPDLLIDNTPYLNQGTSFKPAPPLQIPAKNDLLAISILDGKVISLSKNGQLAIGSDSKKLWLDKDSPPRLAAVIGPFDQGKKPAAIVLTDSSLTCYSLDGKSSDFARLTGEPLGAYLKDSDGKFVNPKLIPIDANGDGRLDLLVLCEKSNFLLINRGFGAYFISPGAAQAALGSAADKPYPFASSATAAHFAPIDTRGDHHEDLIILTPDGALYRLSNPPPK